MSENKIGNKRYLIYLTKININEAEYFAKSDRERRRIWINYMAWCSKHANLYNAAKGHCKIVDHDDFNNYLRGI